MKCWEIASRRRGSSKQEEGVGWTGPCRVQEPRGSSQEHQPCVEAALLENSAEQLRRLWLSGERQQPDANPWRRQHRGQSPLDPSSSWAAGTCSNSASEGCSCGKSSQAGGWISVLYRSDSLAHGSGWRIGCCCWQRSSLQCSCQPEYALLHVQCCCSSRQQALKQGKGVMAVASMGGVEGCPCVPARCTTHASHVSSRQCSPALLLKRGRRPKLTAGWVGGLRRSFPFGRVVLYPWG